MNRGKLRHKISVERFTRADDDFTDGAGVWGEVAEYWAEFIPRQRVKAQIGDEMVEHVAKARFRVEEAYMIKEGDRIVLGEHGVYADPYDEPYSGATRAFTIVELRETDNVGKWYDLEVEEIRDTV